MRRLIPALAIATLFGGCGSEQLDDSERGQIALRQYTCYACHSIPGVVGPQATVGPPLNDLARRVYVANLKNTRENLKFFIQHPQRVDPNGAMPDLGVTDADADDMIAYLYEH